MRLVSDLDIADDLQTNNLKGLCQSPKYSEVKWGTYLPPASERSTTVRRCIGIVERNNVNEEGTASHHPMDITKSRSNLPIEGLPIAEVEGDGNLISSCGGSNCTIQLCTERR